MSLHGSSPAGVRAVIARVLSGRLPFLLFFLLFFLPFALAWSPVVRALRVSWPAEQQHLHTVLFACAVVRQILESGIQDGPFLWSLRVLPLRVARFVRAGCATTHAPRQDAASDRICADPAVHGRSAICPRWYWCHAQSGRSAISLPGDHAAPRHQLFRPESIPAPMGR